MTAPHKGLFSAILHTLNYKGQNPNWLEGWPEGYLHQRDQWAEDSNSGPPGYESVLETARPCCLPAYKSSWSIQTLLKHDQPIITETLLGYWDDCQKNQMIETTAVIWIGYPDDRDDHNRSEMIWNTLISPCQDPLDLLSDLVIFAYEYMLLLIQGINLKSQCI